MEKTGNKETASLFIILVISHVIISGMAGFVKNSGTAAFINVLCSALLTLALVLFCSGAFAGRGITEVVCKCYGKRAGGIIIFLLFALTVLNASSRMGVFADVLKKYVLSETPKTLILAVMGLCVFSAAYFGIEAVTRYSLALFAGFAVIFAVILLCAYPETEYINLCPVFGKGNFLNVFSMLYVFSDFVYIYLISKNIRKSVKKVALTSVTVSALISTVAVLFYTLCVPYPVSGEFEYPIYRLASLSNSAVVFQRLDGLVYILWFFSSFISAGALGYFAVSLFAEMFGLADRRAITSAVIILIFLLSWIDMADAVNTLMSVFAFLFVPVTVLIFRRKQK